MHAIASIVSCGPSRWSVPQVSVHRLLQAHVGYRSALMLGSNIEVRELIVHAVMWTALEAKLGAMMDDGTTVELDYQWHLRKVMATRGMFATADLRPLLVERGVELSQSQVYRLVVERPERLGLRTLMALLDILDCTITDLIEPLPARGARYTGKAVDGGEAGTKSP